MQASFGHTTRVLRCMQDIVCIAKKVCAHVCPDQSLHAACREVPRSCTLFCRPGEGIYRYIHGCDIKLPLESRRTVPVQAQQALPCTCTGMMRKT